jgi:hypothetical protein
VLGTEGDGRNVRDQMTERDAQELFALDAALGAPVKERAGSASSTALGELGTPPAPQPHGTFSLPALRSVDVLLVVGAVVVPLVTVLPILLAQLLAPGPSHVGILVVSGVFAAAFVVPGAWWLLKLVRRLRERRGDTSRLRVGPEGIWLRELGTVPWALVDQVRMERAGWVRQIGRRPRRRWRLVVRTGSGPAGREARVASDELDAPFQDVLDLVRFYHPVTEPA